MASLPVYDRTGAEVGRYEIDPAQIAPKISKQLLHDAVVMYLANRRQGTAKTKPRNEVAGSTRKLYRQKGTGNARVGSARAPHRRGGGHAKAIRPRSYYYRLPKKAIRAATRMAIASKIGSGQVVVIDKLDFAAPKTKDFAAMLKALNLNAMSKTTRSFAITLSYIWRKWPFQLLKIRNSAITSPPCMGSAARRLVTPSITLLAGVISWM